MPVFNVGVYSVSGGDWTTLNLGTIKPTRVIEEMLLEKESEPNPAMLAKLPREYAAENLHTDGRVTLHGLSLQQPSSEMMAGPC